MWKQFTFNDSYKWFNLLPRLVSNYNKSSKRLVDVIPAVIEKLLTTAYTAIKIAAPAKFEMGDSVHVNKYKTIFEKGYAPNWVTGVIKVRACVRACARACVRERERERERERNMKNVSRTQRLIK